MTPLFILLGVLYLVFWWTVAGAIILACLQDAHCAPDDRDPMVSDLPLWQVLLCGPAAWAIRFYQGRAR